MDIELALRALADPTRLRIMRLVARMELAVGEIAQVLNQSQPRVSQHVAKLCDAGLVQRHKEGNSAFLRLARDEAAQVSLTATITALLDAAETEDPRFAQLCADDRAALDAICDAREDKANAYFARHADEWDALRSFHGPDAPVEQALLKALSDQTLGNVLDVGTGTGRMAELLCDSADRVVALDKSLDMLRVARAKLQTFAPGKIELVQGDFEDLPFEKHSFDTVLFHQVLHFAHSPDRALREASSVLAPDGRLIIVDLARHEREELREIHQHRRLGFSDEGIARRFAESGLTSNPPIPIPGRDLTVTIWIGTKRADRGTSRTLKAA